MAVLVNLAKKYSDFDKPIGAETDEYYPSIWFDEKQMDAMGLDNARVGSVMTMIATIRVSSVSENKNGARSISFELIEAAIKPKEKTEDAASILFPNG